MSENIALTYQVSLDSLREGTRYLTRRMGAEARRSWTSRLAVNIVAASFGGISLLFIVSQARDGRFELLAFYLGIIAGVIIYWRMLITHGNKITAARFRTAEVEGPINAEFSECGIKLSSAFARTEVSWRGVDEVWDLPKSICFVFGVLAHPIPRSVFASTRDAEDFFRQVTDWRKAAR